ncbi:MAG: hypothetical protein ABFC94_16640 [Syntrophomonas sp.]
MVKYKKLVVVFVLMLLMLTGGCKFDSGKLLQKDDKPQLIKVQICFTNGEKLTGYVESLGIEGSDKVYVGGLSLNYLYDKNGKIIGSYNYNGVLYIKILSK